MSNNYYYLVASLPRIAFELELKDISIPALKEEVRINVPESDYAHVNTLFTPYDIQNLLKLVLNRKLPFSDKGKFTEDQLREALDNPSMLPSYMADFVKQYHTKQEQEEEKEEQEEEKQIPISDPESYLLNRFYDVVTTSRNMFIRKWFTFDRDLRNIQAAIVARNTGVEKENILIGANELVKSLIKNQSADFGLRTEVDYMDTLMHIIDTADMLERERRLDMLRWSMAESLAEKSNFNIDYILSFLQKADIADRWIKLDKQTGMEMFKSILNDIQAKFDVRTATSEDVMLGKIKRKEE